MSDRVWQGGTWPRWARLAGLAVMALAVSAVQAQNSGRGWVEVRGRELLRDGQPWIAHGFYQIAFEVAPANLARADHPFWANAQQHYKPEEYQYMRDAGADSVRLQIAQAAADPQSPLFDRAFLERALGAVQSARDAGLTVIVAVQDESHVPGETPIALPDDGTRRVWREIAPRFAHDHGVLYELLNEPRPQPSPQNWQHWREAMTATLRVVRELGAENVVVADGLGVGQILNGAPLLPDPHVVYSSHPYALAAQGQTPQVWDTKFGNFSRRAPVLITEWFFGGYFCNGDTPTATVQFLQYLQQHHIGLEAGVWDWASGGFGSARWNFPHGQFSSFAGKGCHEPGYGMGETVHAWYTDGAPPREPR